MGTFFVRLSNIQTPESIPRLESGHVKALNKELKICAFRNYLREIIKFPNVSDLAMSIISKNKI